MDIFKNTFTSYFTQSHFTSISKFGETVYDDEEVQMAFMMANTLISILMLTSLIGGFMAVNYICKGDSERSKNIRLSLYILLILSGGQIGWLFLLLWLFKIDISN